MSQVALFVDSAVPGLDLYLNRARQRARAVPYYVGHALVRRVLLYC